MVVFAASLIPSNPPTSPALPDVAVAYTSISAYEFSMRFVPAFAVPTKPPIVSTPRTSPAAETPVIFVSSMNPTTVPTALFPITSESTNATFVI